MVVYGLTGGIGCGKSAAGEILAARGVPVIDTDDIARELTKPGRPEIEEIAALFGREVLSGAGLDRKRLAEIVFSSEKNRKGLEDLLHPRIRSEWLRRLGELREGARWPAAVVIMPLLFETGAEREVDRTICLGCAERTQEKRLSGRGWSDEHIRLRVAAQLPTREKMERADYVVWNEFDLEICEEQLLRVFPQNA